MALPQTTFAAARLRLARRARITAQLEDVAAELLWTSPFWLSALVAWELDSGTLPAAVVKVGIVVLGPFALLLLLLSCIGVPVSAWVLLRRLTRLPSLMSWLVRAPLEVRAREQLLAHGRVPADWIDQSRRHQRAVQTLLHDDPELVRDDDGVRVLGVVPGICPSCGAHLHQPGPGLRACGHCEYRSYRRIPAPSKAWTEARDGGGMAFWPSLVHRHDWLPALFGLSALPYIAYLLLLWLSHFLVPLGEPPPDALKVAGTISLMVSMLGCTGLVLSALLVGRHWLSHRPGARAFDLQLRGEVFRLVGAHGSVELDSIAAHLGVTRTQLDTSLTRLLQGRNLPVFHDRERDRLVSAFFRASESLCTTCGGRLEPTDSGLTCASCGTIAVALDGQRHQPEASDDVVGDGKSRLRLKLAQTTLEGGGHLSGSVRVAYPAARRCEGVQVRLVQEVLGHIDEYDTQDVVAEVHLLRHAEALDHAEARFSLAVPHRAPSWKGALLQVRWAVEARLTGSDLHVRLPVVVKPGPGTTALETRLANEARSARLWNRVKQVLAVGAKQVLPVAIMVAILVVPLLNSAPYVRFSAGAVVAFFVGLGFWVRRSAWTSWRNRVWYDGGVKLDVTAWMGQPLPVTVSLLRLPVSGTVRWRLLRTESSGWTEVRKRKKGNTQVVVNWKRVSRWVAEGSLVTAGTHVLKVPVPQLTGATFEQALREVSWTFRVRVESLDKPAVYDTALDVLPLVWHDHGGEA